MGWWNPDDSGFQASAFMVAKVSATLDIADPNGFDPLVYNNSLLATNQTTLQTFLLNELHAYAGIPLAGADTDHNGLPGVVQPFDMYYILQYQTQVGGGNADWFAAPMLDRSAFKIRPAFGARYLAVREKFNFAGADSGLGYTINATTSQLGGLGGGGGGGNGVGQATGNLSPSTLEYTNQPVDAMYSALTSTVNTQLAGPEAGLRFDFGKEKFRIWTTSKLGLLVNYSTRQLYGFNIGDAYYQVPGTIIGDPNTTVMPRANGTTIPNNTFASSNASTMLSPMFEQGVFIKANLFQFVPVLNKSKVFNAAELQLGYTAIFVGNMSRPASDINWLAFPINPQLTSYHQTFFTSNYSLGVQWNY
jgi:hypothetical protein